jgi:sodium transport system permease protein
VRGPVWIVFVKECVENLRDRRTVLNSLVLAPLLGPLAFTLLLTLVAAREVERASHPPHVPVVGAARAPELVGFLRRRGLVLQEPPADPEAALRDQDAELVLRIPPGFAAQWRAGQPARVELLFDGSHRDSATTAHRVAAALAEYNRLAASRRLTAQGLGPELLTPVTIEERDVSTPRTRAVLLFGVLPYLMILTALIGGMYLAIDTTAGERERQSLEPLLVNPVPRWRIVAGKLAATYAFTMAAVAITLVAFSAAARSVPVERLGLGLRLDLDPEALATIALIMAPLGLLAAAVQTTIAAFARTYREAQTYLGMVLMVPLIPAVVLMVTPVKLKLWMAAVPLLAQHLLILAVVRGEGPGPAALGVCLGAGSALALAACLLLVRLYGREQLAVSA